MPGAPWTAEEDAIASQMLASGARLAEIGKRLNRTSDGVRSRIKIKHWARGMRQPEPQVEMPVEAFKNSAMAMATARIADLEQQLAKAASSHEPRIPVYTAAEIPVDMEELWRRTAEESKRRIKYLHESSRFSVNVDEFDAGLPIAVSAISDQHIAPGTPVDHERMKLDAEVIRDTPGMYAILGGDGVDNHIKHRAAVMAARSQPGDQWQMYDYYLGILATKLWVIISGNHDAWTNQIGGIDMVLTLANKNRLMYSPDEARISVSHGGAEYKIAIRHQYRMNSSFNQTHAVKQWYRNGEELFDIGIVCHHHEAAIECFVGHGKPRWAARPGAYQITSAYSRQYGYNVTEPTCPTFILWPHERKILGLPCVHDAALLLPSLRQQYRQARAA